MDLYVFLLKPPSIPLFKPHCTRTVRIHDQSTYYELLVQYVLTSTRYCIVRLIALPIVSGKYYFRMDLFGRYLTPLLVHDRRYVHDRACSCILRKHGQTYTKTVLRRTYSGVRTSVALIVQMSMYDRLYLK